MFGLAWLVLGACGTRENDDRRRLGQDAFIDVSRGEEPVCGTLQIDLIDTAADSRDEGSNSTYTNSFRRSARYRGMEDNDIRGYLDGSFKEGWNQVSQVHLRLGRRGRNPAFGEYELFRNLQRWADLPLPVTVNVLDADIVLSLESGPPFAVDVAVYAVLKDWNPGNGGINGDNNSPPQPGDAWWVDAKYGETPWSRAGAGHASDTDANADTGAQPLAIARYTPQQSQHLVFSSGNLTRYIDARIRAGKPVLLLYKLLDVFEDSPGSVFEIWSANYGIEGATRRPTLNIRWQSTDKVSGNTYPVVLEPGRATEINDIAVGGKRIIATHFLPDPEMVTRNELLGCARLPHLEYRASGSGEHWMPLASPSAIDATSIDVRVSAATRPVPLGEAFVSRIRDTWVTSGKPEDQQVHWEFESPDGRRLNKTSDYIGDYTWRVTLATDAIGRWRYSWRHSLAGHQVESDSYHFDVVAWERDDVADGLKSLREAILASGAAPGTFDMIPFELSFMRLERAAMALAADAATDVDLRSKIRAVRETMSGKPVPQEFEPEAIKSRATSPSKPR